MNVLFCTTIFDHAITGAGRFAQCVARLHDYDPEIRVHVLSEETLGEEAPAGKRFPVTLSKGSRLRVLSYFYKSRDYATRIKRVLEQEHIDVVFINDAWLAYHLLKQGHQMTAIVFIHDDHAMHPLKNTWGGIPAMLVRRMLERTSVRRATSVLTNSDYMRSKISFTYGRPMDHIGVIPLAFTDYSRIEYSWRPIIKHQPIRVLFIKNDITRGGLGILVRALASLKQYQFEFTVIGPDVDKVKKTFGSAIHAYAHIRWNIDGPITEHNRVLELMQGQHIFCVPALREAFGISNLEALVSGLRVVYHGVGGIPKELENSGYRIADRNSAALQATLLEAIEMEPGKSEQRIRIGRDWVIQHFSLQTMEQALINLFQEAMTSTSKPKFLTS